MVQIKVADIFLDLYEFDPPKLNFAIEDITDTSARSEFSRTFRVPATSNNSQFFETVFEINGFDFDITQKIQADLLIDGSLFRQGELRLNKIYITRENEKIDYECIFFGTTRNLASAIGESTLDSIDLSELDHELDYGNITSSWNAYPQNLAGWPYSDTGVDAGLFSGTVIYPLIDHGNTYDTNGVVQQGEIKHSNAAHSKPFTNSSYALDENRMKPMIRAKYVWDKIFEEAGFTYTSTFLNSALFKRLYLSAFGNEARIDTPSNGNTAKGRGIETSSGEEVNISDVIFYDFGNNITNGRYVMPVNSTIEANFSLVGVGRSSGANVTLYLRKFDGVTTTTLASVFDFFSPQGGEDEVIVNLSDTFTSLSNLNIGDEIYIEFVTNFPLDYQGTLEITEVEGDVSMTSLLSDEYKKIDFIRDIITKFRLVLAPDKNDSSNFIIEPWQSYIATGDLFDWTDKLDISKDVIIEPIFYTQKSKIEFRDKEGGDFLNDLYQNQFQEPFGSLNVYSNNELIEGDRKIETNIIPTPVSQIYGAEQANNGMDNTIIPLLHVQEPVNGQTQYEPLSENKKLMFWNGLRWTGSISAYRDFWYLAAGALPPVGYAAYPMVSPYLDFPVSASTLDISWQREQGYIQFGLHDVNVGTSVYDTYWSNYIESLYDKWARRVTAYFVLNADDLRNFSFDDIIFFKDAYYYVEKITDVPLGEKASVKVDLIKILDESQVPQPTSPPLPPPSPTPTPTPTPSPILLDPDAEAFLEDVVAAGGTVDSTMSGATDTFYKALKTNNIWSKMILFYPLIGGTSASHSVMGIRSSGTTYDLTMVGGMTHGVSGATGNGTNSGMRTRYLANNLPTTRGQGMYIVNGTARAQYQMGGGNGMYNLQIISYGTGSGYIGFGSFKTYNPTTVGDRLSGNIVATINGSNQVNAYKNGTQVITNSSGSNIRGSNELSLLCDNRLTSPSFSTTESADSTMAFAWYSELLSDTEMRTLSQLINTYQTSLGRNIH